MEQIESKRSTIFDGVMVERGTWVFRDGKCIPKNEAHRERVVEASEKRSALPAPYVMSDIQPYQSMVDGSMITSRSEHRDHLRQHGCEEVGNEKLSFEKPVAPKGEIAREIKDTIEQLKAGYVDPELGPTHDSDGNPIVEPDIEPVVISGDVKNGDVIRSDVLPDAGIKL